MNNLHDERRTVLLQTRIKRTVVATIGKFYLENEHLPLPLNRSQFLNTAVTDLMNIIVSTGKVTKVTSIEEADRILTRLNLITKKEK